MKNINYSLMNNNIEKLESSFMNGFLVGVGFTLASLFAFYLASRVRENRE